MSASQLWEFPPSSGSTLPFVGDQYKFEMEVVDKELRHSQWEESTIIGFARWSRSLRPHLNEAILFTIRTIVMVSMAIVQFVICHKL